MKVGNAMCLTFFVGILAGSVAGSGAPLWVRLLVGLPLAVAVGVFAARMEARHES